jgi:hypothetical protein
MLGEGWLKSLNIIIAHSYGILNVLDVKDIWIIFYKGNLYSAEENTTTTGICTL